MGTWGAGILQNDNAWESVEERTDAVRRQLARLGDSDRDAERMLAAVAVLMQCSPSSFDPENPDHAALTAVVTRLRPRLTALSDEAAAALDAIARGAEPPYERLVLPARLERILHGAEPSPFAVEWARAPAGAFDTPGGRAFVQEVADACVAAIDEDFATGTLEDPCSESYAVGQLALLLILDAIHVAPARFVAWRDAWRAERRSTDEPDFHARYDAALEDAFAYGIERFST